MRTFFSFGNYGKWIFLFVSAGVVVAFLYFSNILVTDLSERERERMEIWADATKEILRQFGDDTHTPVGNGVESDETDVFVEQPPVADIGFLLRIIEGNTTIPVLLTDEYGQISLQRNFDLPEPFSAADRYVDLSASNRRYLDKKLESLAGSANVIDIELEPGVVQHLYYEDSRLLQRLSYFPYVQLAVMIVFLLIVYFAVTSSKQAEQNKVWVGLSKETAHQLGTPISSLMAWMELLPEMGANPDTCAEIGKDVRRLSTIASRFSKIGSKPSMETIDLSDLVSRACEYMSTRISSRIRLTLHTDGTEAIVNASAPLFEWVMENLIKNAVDAIDGDGRIDVYVAVEGTAGRHPRAVIEVADTGRGIPAKNRKRVFRPGYTTKRRGWGLGLTLARRIVEQYHGGRIFVRDSAPGRGTTFRIELPLRAGSTINVKCRDAYRGEIFAVEQRSNAGIVTERQREKRPRDAEGR